ncbi:atrophin-1-like [Paramacrobiotus metropolitanus]|uniref:atrophin-1-like n=1 Tax=Paramacrobiotus metropolitanus TaxID=2943436 RepID=UPI0024463ED8|nr:atrophin-1-like [Paramacrobiotus metropolitanus]
MIATKIIDGYVPLISEIVSPIFTELIELCLRKESKSRPSAENLKTLLLDNMPVITISNKSPRNFGTRTSRCICGNGSNIHEFFRLGCQDATTKPSDNGRLNGIREESGQAPASRLPAENNGVISPRRPASPVPFFRTHLEEQQEQLLITEGQTHSKTHIMSSLSPASVDNSGHGFTSPDVPVGSSTRPYRAAPPPPNTLHRSLPQLTENLPPAEDVHAALRLPPERTGYLNRSYSAQTVVTVPDRVSTAKLAPNSSSQLQFHRPAPPPPLLKSQISLPSIISSGTVVVARKSTAPLPHYRAENLKRVKSKSHSAQSMVTMPQTGRAFGNFLPSQLIISRPAPPPPVGQHRSSSLLTVPSPTSRETATHSWPRQMMTHNETVQRSQIKRPSNQRIPPPPHPNARTSGVVSKTAMANDPGTANDEIHTGFAPSPER